jgi:hypothetical protein
MGENPPTDEPAADARQDPDPLRRLEQRLDLASQAAERLIAQAAAAAAGAATTRKPPAAGWQLPDSEPERAQRTGTELDLLLEAVHALRDRIPPDLQRRLGEALRELLLALRALIDWYLERTQRSRAQEPEVQDIPIN